MATAEDFFSSNYLKATDLGGKEITVTIDRVESDTFENDGRRQVKPVIHFRESGIKPLVSNETNFLMVAAACGKDTNTWPGKQVTLYADLVPFKGSVTEAVRIRRAPAKAEFNDELTI